MCLAKIISYMTWWKPKIFMSLTLFLSQIVTEKKIKVSNHFEVRTLDSLIYSFDWFAQVSLNTPDERCTCQGGGQ